MRYVSAFGRFWYDFIVGDSVLLAIGGVIVVSLAKALAELDASKVAEVALPLVVIATLWVSLPRRRH